MLTHVSEVLPVLCAAGVLSLWWAARTRAAWGALLLRADRRWWLWTLAAHQLLFWCGVLVGRAVPEIQERLSAVGREALGHTGIASLQGFGEFAGGIWLWNGLVGLLLTNALPNAALGLGAPLVNVLRMPAVGVALSAQPPAVLLAHLPTLLLELTAYGLMTWAGFCVVRSLAGQVKLGARLTAQQLMASLRPTWAMLPLSVALLWLGAVYEAAEILWILPLLR